MRKQHKVNCKMFAGASTSAHEERSDPNAQPQTVGKESSQKANASGYEQHNVCGTISICDLARILPGTFPMSGSLLISSVNFWATVASTLGCRCELAITSQQSQLRQLAAKCLFPFASVKTFTFCITSQLFL